MTGGDTGGIKAIGRLAGQWLLDCLLPKYCLACGVEGEYWCEACRTIPPAPYPPVCFGCHKAVNFGSLCSDCRPRYAFDGLIIGTDYDSEIVSGLIRACKYRFVSEIADCLALLAQRGIVSFLKQEIKDSIIATEFFSAVVIPMPLSRRRYRWRGFNQAALIARHVAENCRLEYNDSFLQRRHRPAQAKLDEHERQANLAGSFSVEGTAPRLIILVDDVVTTGTTLHEAAKALKAAGAEEVWGVTVAKG